jgi:hypothetical protein
MQNEEYREQVKKTNLEKNGYENPLMYYNRFKNNI